MADTSQQELSEPHTNGVIDGLTEEEKSKMRPADIDADMREMERRKRVEMMMNSRLFREELERIIETQMKDGAGPSGLLQQISEMMGPQGARFNANVFKNSNCVVPINDIRGVESMGYAKGEKLLRCKLAAVFRLLDLYGWTQGVGGLITARLNQDQEHFLVNPYGLLYHEITASSLVKVDMQGTVVEQGTTNFGVHIAGFQLHSTIHAARPDIKCIVHISTPSVTAISSMKCGLLPLGQESIVIGEVSNHQYVGGSFEPEEREKMTRNLGPISKVMLLTNRGALCCGETVEEAFFNVYNTVLACETQLKLMPAGLDNMNLISEESKKAIFEASRKPPVPQQSSIAEPSPLAEKLEKRWRIGGTEFEALMRMLDNAGFRTGYIYRHPLVKSEPPRPRNDVEVPPAVSSLGYLLEEEELYKQGLWKGGRKGTDRTRWLNSPNVYQKVEILETGTPDPKKITKWVDQNAEEWVTDGSPTHSSTPVKIESALQFVPKNTNPKEFKQLQQQIKDYRRADKISAGPQSHILEGVTWEEAKKMQDATISGTGEQVVLVGAASKGIIQRGFQHNAMVYKTPYAKNPFDAITDQELDQYKKDVERKQKGDPYDESQSESEALSSFNISRATHESSTAKSPIQSPVSVTSETEEESRDEPRVLRIATKQVPVPSQPEVVLSDVDATTQFLNEMRRSTIESRNNANKRDIGQSSSCSSEIEGLSYSSWQSSESVDKPRLEVTKTSTVAEIMKPVLMKIDSSTLSSKFENNVVFDQKPRPFCNSRQNNVLKREFFQNYEKRIINNNLLNCYGPNSREAINSHIVVNDDKLRKTINVTLNLNGNVDENENFDNRGNAKKNLGKKVNSKIKDYKDTRDENSVDVVSKTVYSSKNNEENSDASKSKKRCARKLNIISKIDDTSVDNLKNSVVKTNFHPLIRCSDVISSEDSDSVSCTKSQTDSRVKSEEIITVNCNVDHCQEISFTQQLNIDLEEKVENDLESDSVSCQEMNFTQQLDVNLEEKVENDLESDSVSCQINFTQQLDFDLEEKVGDDLESDSLSHASISEPLQAPSLVKKIVDSNSKLILSNQESNVSETKDEENKSVDFAPDENETVDNAKEFPSESQKMINEKKEETTEEIQEMDQQDTASNGQKVIVPENFDVNNQVSENVMESINHENVDGSEDIPKVESETNEEKQISVGKVSKKAKKSNKCKKVDDKSKSNAQEVIVPENFDDNNQVSENVMKSINHENVDGSEDIPKIESKTNKEKPMSVGKVSKKAKKSNKCKKADDKPKSKSNAQEVIVPENFDDNNQVSENVVESINHENVDGSEDIPKVESETNEKQTSGGNVSNKANKSDNCTKVDDKPKSKRKRKGKGKQSTAETETNEEKQSLVNNEVSETVQESINHENADSNKDIPTIESEQATMTNEFNNSGKTGCKSDHNDHDSSVAVGKENGSDKIANSLNNNESFHSKISEKESCPETDRNDQDESHKSSKSNDDEEIKEKFLYFSETEILQATERSEAFKNEVNLSCKGEEFDMKNCIESKGSSSDTNDTSSPGDKNENIISNPENGVECDLNIKEDLVSDEANEVKEQLEQQNSETEDKNKNICTGSDQNVECDLNVPENSSDDVNENKVQELPEQQNSENEDKNENTCIGSDQNVECDLNVKEDLVSAETNKKEVEEQLEQKNSETEDKNKNICIGSDQNVECDLNVPENFLDDVNENKAVELPEQQNSETEDKNENIGSDQNVECDLNVQEDSVSNDANRNEVEPEQKKSANEDKIQNLEYEDFVKEISSSSSEGEINSVTNKENFHSKESNSRDEIEGGVKETEDMFDLSNANYENIEDIEEFQTSYELEETNNAGNIGAFIDEIFTFKHSDIEVDELFSKVYDKIVHKADEDKPKKKKSRKGATHPQEQYSQNCGNNIEFVSSTSSKCHDRRDSISDMINNINVNISSSITTFENLPETDNSQKYNLDPTNMSLIYSLTPTELSSKKGFSSKNTSIEMMGLSMGSFEDFDQLYPIRNLKRDPYDWLDLASPKKQRDEILNTQKELLLVKSFPNLKILSDCSNDESLSDVENNSTQGSDILELPSSTYQELKKNDDESFRQELNSTVNEILNDLKNTEIYACATDFVDDIIYEITCLNMYMDLNNLKQDATLLMKNRIYAFLIVKDIIERLISTLPSNEQEELNSQLENDLQTDALKNLIEHDENLDNFVVIQEIVHHIIDKFDCDNSTLSISKEIKETVNIELQKCPNKISKDAEGKEIGLEGLLKNMKDDDILPCNCPECMPTENKEFSETQKDQECIKKLLHLMNPDQNEIVQEGNNLESQETETVGNASSSEDDDDILNLRTKLINMFSLGKNVKCPPTSTLNSSPSEIHSAESENFAEQEVTSESTDNDTKSDNSREKEILRLDFCASDNVDVVEVLSDQDIKFLWNMRESKIEENCKNERFRLLERSPSFIHFSDFEENEEKICTCCLNVSIGDESSTKLPPIEEESEGAEFNCNQTVKLFDQSFYSPHSSEFFSCRDTSESWKSVIDTRMNTTRELEEKLEDSFQDADYDENQNATYTISDVSDNDKTSELEYNADVSSNLEVRKSETTGIKIEENHNNTSLNFADVSASTFYETSPEVENPKNPPDYMTYSYDTKEFMKLEKHLEEQDRVCCNFEKSEFISLSEQPKYEETSLYRVVTQMNLADTDSCSSFNNNSRDILE